MRVDDSRFPHLWFVFTQALIDLAYWNLYTMPECLLRSQCTHKHLQLKDFYFKNAVRNVKEEEHTHGTMWCIVLTFPFKAYTPENTHTYRHANYKKYIDPLLMADRFPRQLRVWSVLYALYRWKIQLGEPFPPCCSILLCLRWHHIRATVRIYFQILGGERKRALWHLAREGQDYEGNPPRAPSHDAHSSV